MNAMHANLDSPSIKAPETWDATETCMLMQLKGGTPFILAHDPARGRLGACHQHAPIPARHRPGAPLWPVYPQRPGPQDVPSHTGVWPHMHACQRFVQDGM